MADVQPDGSKGDDPFVIARKWLEEASASEINDPNGVALATVDETGLPNVRMVLLKEIEENRTSGGIRFLYEFRECKRL